MTYDLIIVTQSKGDLIQVTKNCIESARQDNAELNVIIVETFEKHDYDCNINILYNEPFNYNHALNIGLQYAHSDIHILANNDIIFHKGWSQIGDLMISNDYHSASIMGPAIDGIQHGDHVYEGYTIGKHVTGWCIFMDKYCLSKIGQLDETCSFWYSDDLYACQLRQAGIKHGLFCNLQVDHMTSQTLIKQNTQMQRKYQLGELAKFRHRQKYYLCQRDVRRS